MDFLCLGQLRRQIPASIDYEKPNRHAEIIVHVFSIEFRIESTHQIFGYFGGQSAALYDRFWPFPALFVVGCRTDSESVQASSEK